MPITLKIKNRTGSTPSGGAAGSLPAHSPPAKRNVSFNDSPQTYDDDDVDAAGAGGSASPSTSVPSAKRLRTSPPTTAPTPKPTPLSRPRRPRSPTPPSHQVPHCLPLPTKRKSRPTAITSEDIEYALDNLILRYAKLAGYDAVHSSVLDVLRRWLALYIGELGEMSEELALLGGRAWPNGRDLMEAMRYQGQIRAGNEDEEATGDTTNASPMDVSPLISWRHAIPDYHDEYANRERHHDPSSSSAESSRSATPTPAWAEQRQVALVEPDSSHGDDDASSESSPAAIALSLLSRKSRMKEKLSRQEIPAHLPDLPPLHAWKRTDAYASTAAAAAKDADVDSIPTNSTPASSSSSTLARLETRLTSSRLVQTSLRSLIGRLDAANAVGGSGSANGSGVNSADLDSPRVGSPSTAVNANPPNTTDAPPPPPSGASRHRRSTSRATIDAAAIPSPPPSSTTAPPPPPPPPRSGRLSIRLRTQSQAGSTSDARLGSPLSSTRSSPAVERNSNDHDGVIPASAAAHRRSLSLKGINTTGVGIIPASPLQTPTAAAYGYGLMSPATPRSAAAATAATPTANANAAATGAWPFFAFPAAGSAVNSPVGAAAASGGGSVVQSPWEVSGAAAAAAAGASAPVVQIPGAVNFKAGWYGRRA